MFNNSQKLTAQFSNSSKLQKIHETPFTKNLDIYGASQELASQAIPLERLSMAQALQAFRGIASDDLHPQQKIQRLRNLLRHAFLDEYPRPDKTRRDYLRKKQERHAGKSKIQTAQILKQTKIG